jgi:hypothetical protein
VPVEPQLPELPQGGLKLGAEWHRRVVRRIEHIKPVAKKGGGIKVEPKDEGHVLSLDGSVGNPITYTYASVLAGNTGISVSITPVQVCSGATSVTLYLLTTAAANSGASGFLLSGGTTSKIVPADPSGFGAGDTALLLHGT